MSAYFILFFFFAAFAADENRDRCWDEQMAVTEGFDS
jgi:hypothetical protein